MIIYLITNKINGKVYVGMTTKSLESRWASHKCDAKNPRSGSRIHQAIKKHGIENFKVEVIDAASSLEELAQKEIAWISKLNSINGKSGYNVRLGGDLWSEELLKKRINSLRGRSLSKEHRANISEANKGHSVSDKVRENAHKNLTKFAGWNKGTVGVMKSNSGSFCKGMKAPNKGRKKIVDENGKTRYVFL